MADPRYRRTKYGTIYQGFNPRRRPGRTSLCPSPLWEEPRPQSPPYLLETPETPETYGWQPAYTHAGLNCTVYEQAGCKLAKLPHGPGWLAQNRHGCLYHYTSPLSLLTPDLLADTRQPKVEEPESSPLPAKSRDSEESSPEPVEGLVEEPAEDLPFDLDLLSGDDWPITNANRLPRKDQ